MTETYTTGGDSEVELEPPKILGQTFSPVEDHTLEFVDLNIKRTTIGGELLVTIHDLEVDPNMVGGGISRGYKFTIARRHFWQFKRTRVTMKKRKLYAGHSYGLCIRHKPDPWWNKYKFQYDAGDATYPRGQRFTKDNIFDPPTYYPNDDLMFGEFGRPVAPPTPPEPPPNPPPTPPDPPIDNWLIIQIDQLRTATGEKIIVYTNVPCHLWMRWSLLPPWIHKIPKTRRGLTTMTDFYYCFDVYTDNEQTGAGDTLAHVFVKEPWPYCEKRWYYFHGEINSIPSKSTSPLFEKHPIEIPHECLRGIDYEMRLAAIIYNHQPAQRFTCHQAHTLQQIELVLEGYPTGAPVEIEIHLCELPEDTFPGNELAMAVVHSDDIPPYGSPNYVLTNIAPTPLIAGKSYGIHLTRHPPDAPLYAAYAWGFGRDVYPYGEYWLYDLISWHRYDYRDLWFCEL